MKTPTNYTERLDWLTRELKEIQSGKIVDFEAHAKLIIETVMPSPELVAEAVYEDVYVEGDTHGAWKCSWNDVKADAIATAQNLMFGPPPPKPPVPPAGSAEIETVTTAFNNGTETTAEFIRPSYPKPILQTLAVEVQQNGNVVLRLNEKPIAVKLQNGELFWNLAREGSNVVSRCLKHLGVEIVGGYMCVLFDGKKINYKDWYDMKGNEVANPLA